MKVEQFQNTVACQVHLEHLEVEQFALVYITVVL